MKEGRRGSGAEGRRGLTAAMIAAGFSAGAIGPLSAQQGVVQGRAIAADAAIRIINPAGSVRVIGWDRDSVAVSGTVGEGGGKFFLGGSDRALKLGVDWPSPEERASSSDLEVRLPRRSRVWVKTITAEIDIDSVSGGVEAVTVSGRVRVAGTPATVNAESIDGGVEIAAESPSVHARTAGGPLVLRGVLRESEASTVSGPLFVGMTGPVNRVRLTTVSGEIAFKGELEPGGSLETESHSGSVELRLPISIGAEFDINSYGGEIRNELTRKGALPLPAKNGEWHFTLGDGKSRVVVRTFKGMVVLKPK